MSNCVPRIQCGNHPLHPEVTITEIYSHAYIDGRLTQVAEQPEIAITCTICGNTSFANDLIFETKHTDRHR